MQLLHYLTQEGRNPYKDWLDRLRDMCGGIKKTQDADIDRAVSYWQSYLRRTR